MTTISIIGSGNMATAVGGPGNRRCRLRGRTRRENAESSRELRR